MVPIPNGDIPSEWPLTQGLETLGEKLAFLHGGLCSFLFPTEGSTIVDGPEVYEDRDPAQREAEGPKGIYGLLRIHIARTTKKYQIELHVGHTHGSENAPYSLLLGLCFSTHITFMLWLAVVRQSANYSLFVVAQARETVHTRFALCPAAYSCSKLQGVLGQRVLGRRLNLPWGFSLQPST